MLTNTQLKYIIPYFHKNPFDRFLLQKKMKKNERSFNWHDILRGIIIYKYKNISTMNSRKIVKTKRRRDADVGSILIAQPFWQDDKYRRSVVLVLNHDNVGTSGLILNKPTTLFVSEVLPQIHAS